MVEYLRDPHLTLKFPEVVLKVGPIMGNYDVILGTPFLSRFNLSVPIALKSLQCNDTNRAIFYYCGTTSVAAATDLPKLLSSDLLAKLCGKILQEFQDLFPGDIPPVSVKPDYLGNLVDGPTALR